MSASPQAKEGEGERVGPYRLLRQLGQGGMGSVYAARHEQLGAVRALKLLPPDADAELVRRFEREGQALAAIDGHPHLVRVHELAADGPRRYMVMDLLEGRDLRRRLNEEGPLPWDEAAALVRDLALALAHAHARGVLHRDVKPANVVFDQRGAPVLVDFGLARVQDAASLSQSGQLLGTPAYMAPEQVRGSREGLGPASDVYGLGALLYACLTGRAPFEGTLLEVLTCVLQRPPTPPRRLRPEVPAALEAVCLRALAKRPEERPPDCEALAAELEAALRDPGRTRVGLLIGPLAVCALLLAGLLALAPRSPAAAPADPAAVAVSASAPPPSDPGVGLQVREAVAAARADPAQLESAASALLDSLLGSSTEPPRIAAALAAAAGDDLPGAALQVWAARSCAARAPRVALALLAPFEGSDRARGLVSAARASTGLPFPLVELSVQLALAHGQEEEALLLLERASSPDRTRLHTLQLFVSWSRLGAGRRTSRSGDLLHADPESLLALLYCLYAVRDEHSPEAGIFRERLLASARDPLYLHSAAAATDVELAVPLLERAYALTYPPPVAGLLTRLRREVNSRAEFGSNVIPSLSGALLEAAQELPPALQLQLQADLAELEGARRMFTSAWERCQAALQRDPCQRRLLLLGAHALQRGLDGLSAEGRLAPRWRPVQRELFARYLLLCRPEALHHYLRLTEDLRKDQRRGW